MNLLGDLSIFLRTCYKKNPSKNPFYEKVKMFKKSPFVVESFVTIGPFDYDHTQKSSTFKQPFINQPHFIASRL
jgi:hypothetical protein